MRLPSVTLVLLAAGVLAAATDAPPQTTPQVSFKNDIMPILQKRCVQCHGGKDENGEVRVEALLDLTTYEGLMAGSEYGTVVEPGDPDESLLVVLIEEGDMPDEGEAVPADEIARIRAWIAEGAKNN